MTLKHMVIPEFLDLVNKKGFAFCPTHDCQVVYFHADGDTLEKVDLRVRVGAVLNFAPILRRKKFFGAP